MGKLRFGLTLCGLACVTYLHAATPASFDNPRSAWTVLRGTGLTDPSVTHQGQMSMRVESGRSNTDARVQSAPIELTIGKSYELTGWIRTERLIVRDLDRSPIATGAALSMASLPFDVQSESLAGTRDWTRVQLRFTATRAHDNIVLAVAYGGTFDGKAWFSGVTVEDAQGAEPWPDPAAVTRYGPAYRYPAGGWIYLHIEGAPYERGYQHGHLMAKEIPQYMERCAAELDPKGKNKSWNLARTTATALFTHGFDQEILAEMKGIADGASDAGARWEGRPIDLTDIVVINTTVELSNLSAALAVTPNGLEGLRLVAPSYVNRKHGVAAGSLQRLRRHRRGYSRRTHGDRPHHVVAAHPGRANQRDARYSTHHRPSHPDAELSRRHRERNGLVSERCRRGAHRDHYQSGPL